MPLLWRSSRESRSERCKRAFLLAPICKVLLAPSLVSDRATLTVIRVLCACLRSYVRLVDTALLGSTPLTVLSDHWYSADRELLLPMGSSPLTGLRTEGILGVPPTSGTTPDTPPPNRHRLCRDGYVAR